jgi:hypothetical protein
MGRNRRHRRDFSRELPYGYTSERFRGELLKIGFRFVREASRVPGVLRISMVGSLCTDKPRPKDIDFLVRVEPGCNLAELARVGRRMQGHGIPGSPGADVFIEEDGRYLGRACSYREWRPRMACLPGFCIFDRPYLCAVDDEFALDAALVAESPLTLWPEVVARVKLPPDVQEFVDDWSTELKPA